MKEICFKRGRCFHFALIYERSRSSSAKRQLLLHGPFAGLIGDTVGQGGARWEKVVWGNNTFPPTHLKPTLPLHTLSHTPLFHTPHSLTPCASPPHTSAHPHNSTLSYITYPTSTHPYPAPSHTHSPFSHQPLPPLSLKHHPPPHIPSIPPHSPPRLVPTVVFTAHYPRRAQESVPNPFN